MFYAKKFRLTSTHVACLHISERKRVRKDLLACQFYFCALGSFPFADYIEIFTEIGSIFERPTKCSFLQRDAWWPVSKVIQIGSSVLACVSCERCAKWLQCLGPQCVLMLFNSIHSAQNSR